MGGNGQGGQLTAPPKPQESGQEGESTIAGGIIFDEWHLPTKTEALKDMPPLLGLVLANRGITDQEQAEHLLHPDFERDTHDPFLFKEMEQAVEVIFQSIEKSNTIFVHGDYDADGISASAILYLTLKKLGANVEVFLPHREKTGYGLRDATVDELAERGANLIITCDCGISDGEAIAKAADMGIDVIVTDHHTIPPQPPERAVAIIHPLVEGEPYPTKSLSGGGVAYKLAQALIRKSDGKFEHAEAFEKWLVDYVAIASIGDMVPLTDETRILTHFGLQVLPKSQRPGLRLMAQAAGEPFSERSVGFYIAPRINAAGRMDHPDAAFRVLVEPDATKAYGYVQELNALNKARTQAVETMMQEITTQLQETSAHEHPIIFVNGSWAPSIAGLAASKLVNKYHKPAVVLAKGEQGLVGSGRSVEGFDLVAALRNLEEYFDRLGGHPAACGFTVKEGAVQALQASLQQAEVTLEPRALQIDAEYPIGLVELETVKQVQALGPFGEGNPKPIFLSRVSIISVDTVGSDNQHLRIFLECGLKRCKSIGFGMGHLEERIDATKPAEIAYELGINNWQGRQEVDIYIKDIRQ